MNAPNRKFKLIIALSVFSLVLIDFLVIWLITFRKPFSKTLLWFFVSLVFMGIIAGIVFLIIWLFKKQKIDLLYVMRQQVIESCEINKPERSVPIFLYDNKNTRPLGFYTGHTIIKSSEWMKFLDPKDTASKNLFRTFLSWGSPDKDDKFKEDYLYICSFKTNKGRVELILLLEGDFNSFDSNPIYFYGNGLSPKLYEFHFLSKHYDIADRIELPIKNLAMKYTIEHNLREMINVVDNAMDLDAGFRKAQEKANIDDFRPKDGEGGRK